MASISRLRFLRFVGSGNSVGLLRRLSMAFLKKANLAGFYLLALINRVFSAIHTSLGGANVYLFLLA
jgi:hypothetical protein